MSELALHAFIALPAGFGLGLFYFGGLYWTLRQIVKARRAKLLIFGSLLVRLGVTFFGFYWISGGHWERLVLCMVGLLGARFFLIFRWGPGKVAIKVPLKKDVIT